MRIEITKGERADRIRVNWPDGTVLDYAMPKKGPVPHDAVHYFVERALGLADAFWGMIARGLHPDAIAEQAKAAGHASAKRAAVPDASIVALLQAERLVECFEADLWGGGGDAQALIAMAQTACDYSHVPLPGMDAMGAERIRSDLNAFAADWIAAPGGHVAALEWN